MSVRYRDHRGGFMDSMATVRELADRAALMAHLRDAYRGVLQVTEAALEVIPYCYDYRNGWQTYLITLHGQGVGYTDGPI